MSSSRRLRAERRRDELILQVRERERHVGPAGERAHRLLAGLARAAGGGLGGEVREQREPPLADHPPGVLDYGGEDALDTAVLAPDRAEGEGEIALFRVAAALEQQQLVLGPCRLAGRDDAVQHWRDHVPDLGPHLLAGATERPEVLLAQDLGVRVVVQDDAPLAPVEHDGEARADADAYRAAQA